MTIEQIIDAQRQGKWSPERYRQILLEYIATYSGAGGGGPIALNDLTDVTITSPASGHTAFYNGSAWVNRAIAQGDVTGLVSALSGKADLSGGKVPSSQLPSFVDDVVEVADVASLPVSGETGKIYVTLDDSLIYRWTGSIYVEISSSIALGSTSGTAHRGDHGTDAYNHSIATGNQHGMGIGDITVNPNVILGRYDAGLASGPAGEIAIGAGLDLAASELKLATSGAVAATYTNPSVTVDAYGRVTSISSGAGTGTVVKLGSDFSTSSGTAQPTGVKFTPAASKTYHVQGIVRIKTDTATVAPRLGVNWPTGTTDPVGCIEQPATSSTNIMRYWGPTSTTANQDTGLPDTTNYYYSRIDFLFTTDGSPSGDFEITLQSETAGTTVYVGAGSFIKYTEI